MKCAECGREFEGGGTCPHCVRDIAHEYESEIHPAAGGEPLAIVGNLFLFAALLPVMLFAWNWMRVTAVLAVAGAVCHGLNRARRAGRAPGDR